VLVVGLALAGLVVAVFAPVRHFDLADFDDRSYIVDNAYVLQGLTWRGLAWAFTTLEMANWHPLTWLSYMIDVELWGVDHAKQHLANLLFHTINTVLLFGLLFRATGAIGRSALVAALFGVHPLHVEPVAWIAERKELLCASFGFLAMWAYVDYARRPSVRSYLLVLIGFALGLMAKPMLVTLPFVLILLDIWPLRRAPGFPTVASAASPVERAVWLRLLREKIPLFGLTVASSVITFAAQHHGGAVAGLDVLPLATRLSNAAVSYATYVEKMIWPERLAIFYPHPESFSGWEVSGSILALIAVTVLVAREARKRPYLLVGWLWYVGTLVPVIGLVQVGAQSMADRYTYLPLIGLFVALAWGASDLAARLPHRDRLLRAAGLIAIAACAITARSQLEHWRDTVTVWTHALAVSPDNARAHNNLGVALGLEGRDGEALAHYIEATRIDPHYAEAHLNLGNSLLNQKRLARAERHYSEAIRIAPHLAGAHFGLAVSLVGQGELARGVREMAVAVGLDPDNASFRYNLAVMLLGQGKRAAAAQHLETVLDLDPGHASARRELDALRGAAHR
jgi:tetratricopeptide (TPR) repeat protein